MRKILRLIIIIIVILFTASFTKDLIIKAVVSVAAEQVTGAKVRIGSFSLGIFRQSVRIRNFIMHNPAGFSQGILVELPRIYVDYDISSLLRGKLHLSFVDVNVKELGLEKNKDGRMNVDSLKISQGQEPKQEKKRAPAKPLGMQIDVLNLEVGRIVSKDYSTQGEPSIKVYDINLKKSYRNITSAQQLAALILTEPMKQAGIRGAKIYAISTLAGAGFFPVTIATTLAGKDSSGQDFNLSRDALYRVCLAVLKDSGIVNKEDKIAYVITAEVEGANVTVRLEEKSPRITQVTISARKYLFPKPEIAKGILYRIAQKLK